MTIKTRTTYSASCEQIGCRRLSKEFGSLDELTTALTALPEGELAGRGWLVEDERHYCFEHCRWDGHLQRRVPAIDPDPWFCDLCGRLSYPNHIGPLHGIPLFDVQSEVTYRPRTPQQLVDDVDERTPQVIAAHAQLRGKRY